MLAKAGGDQRHASMMSAMTDVSGVAHVMDVVPMATLRMHRMFYRESDRFDGGAGCGRF